MPQVFPKCGDGVDFSVVLRPGVTSAEVQTLHEADYELSIRPVRQRLHFYLDQLTAGDLIDLIVSPRKNHDCDGALILGFEVWDQAEYKG